ncbi:MAG: hypothetical protein AAF763_14915 [Pseudomonadota bacterium]
MFLRSATTCVALLAAAPATALTFTPVTPGPLGQDSGTNTRTFVAISGIEPRSTSIVAPVVQNRSTNEFGQSLSARADLAAGETGAAVTFDPLTDFDNVSADGQIFDVVEFSFPGATSGAVTFTMSVDGTLSNSNDPEGSDTVVIGSGLARVFDVTGLDDAFLVIGSEGASSNVVSPNIEGFFDEDIPPFGEFVFTNLAAEASAGLALVPENLVSDIEAGLFAIGGADDFLVDVSGEPVEFDKTVEAGFIAEEGRAYAVQILTNVAAFGDSPGSADLMGTTSFEFTDLSGGTAFSASGLLPGTIAAPPEPDGSAEIPLPAPVALLLTGLLGLGAAAKRRRG